MTVRGLRNWPWIARGIFACGLLATIASWAAYRNSATELAATRFQDHCDDIRAAIDSRVRGYAQILRGAQAALGAGNRPSADEWLRLHRTLDFAETYPGVAAFAYLRAMTRADRDAALADIRRFEPELSIRPPGDRAEYVVVTNVAPRGPHDLPALGSDSWSNPDRRRALAAARDEGGNRITGKVSLVIDDPQKPQAGFLMYQPVYRTGTIPASVGERRASLAGYIAIGVRVDPLMRGILGDGPRLTSVRVFDQDVPAGAALMYASDPQLDLSGAEFQRIDRIDVAGRSWTVQFASLADPVSAGRRATSLGILVAGATISILLAGLVATLQSSRTRAESLARTMSAASRENETKLKALISQAPIGIWLLDRQGCILDCNDRLAEFAGVPRERLIGFSMLGEARDKVLDEPIKSAIAGQTVSIETTYTSTTGGRSSYYQFLFKPVYLEGRFELVLGFVEEIRQRKEAEAMLRASGEALRASEKRFSLLFEWSPLPLAYASESDGYTETTWNKAWFDQFGYAPEEVGDRDGASIGLWVNPEERQAFLNDIVRTGAVARREVRMRRHDGTERIIQLYGRIVEAGDQRLLLACYDDVTEIQRKEAAILQLNSGLEAMVGERTRDLQEANARLTATLGTLQRAQSELVRSEKMAALGALVAGVAHELNTPIGNCLTAASTFEVRTAEIHKAFASGAIRKSDLADYLSSAARVSALLTRSMARAHELVVRFKQVAVDQASENRRVFELREVVEEVVAMLQPTFKRTPYRIETSIPDGIAMDSYPGPLGQVVGNLVNNALLHGFDGRSHGTVRIQAHCVEGTVTIEVEDDGAGMAPNVRAHAFDPFFTTRLGQGGSGLGLHIVFNIVTGVLGGSIELASQEGEGTRLTIRIPCKAPAASRSAEPADRAGPVDSA